MSYIKQETSTSISEIDTTYSVFLLKKTEAVAAALTLVARYIKDEPQSASLLRECAIRLIKDVHEFSPASVTSAQSVKRHIGETISLLHMLDRTQVLSSSNVKLIVDELNNLHDLLLQENTYRAEPNFSQCFVREPVPPHSAIHRGAFRHYGHNKDIVYPYGTRSSQTKDSMTKSHVQVPTGPQQNAEYTASVAKNEFQKDRRAIILGLLQKKDKVTVKDVSNVIKDVSDKTLQRELLALVAQGVLKKEGERRWSTYSLRG